MLTFGRWQVCIYCADLTKPQTALLYARKILKAMFSEEIYTRLFV